MSRNTGTKIRESPVIRVGVGVLVKRNGLVLVGLRKGNHGAQTWSFPGGHVEFGENPVDTARREVLEETGLLIDHVRPLTFTSDYFEHEQQHYITLFYTALSSKGEARITEPDKCAGWRWAPYNDLPEPLFLPIVNLKKLLPELP